VGFKSEYLDLAIAMAVVFFLASLIVSGLNEGIQRAFRIRSKFLWAFLHDLADKQRTKALPEGKAGVINLRGNDMRPLMKLAQPTRQKGEPSSPARDMARRWAAAPTPSARQVDGSGRTSDFLQLLFRSLEPIGAPELRSKDKKAKQKTTISHVPTASLAQAFLEVFAEVGRTRMDALVLELSERLLADDPMGDAALVMRVAEGAGKEKEAAFSDALAAFVAAVRGAKDDGAAAVVFSRSVAVIPGAHTGVVQGEDLSTAAAGLVSAVRAAQPHDPGSATPEPVRTAAETMSSAIIRTFPEGFARQRIDVALAGLEDSPIGPTARRLWEAAEGKVDEFRAGLEHWFDSEMIRLGGYYKRSIRVILAILALVVAFTLNIDSLQLVRDLWRNPDGRTALVTQADELAATPGATPPAAGTLRKLQADCEAEAATTTVEGTDVEKTTDRIRAARTCVNDALNKLSGLNVVDRPIWKASLWGEDWTKSWAWILHPLGLAGTTLALVLGAPFWFDLLKRLTGIRSGKVGQT
jgi:hypothetical protein